MDRQHHGAISLNDYLDPQYANHISVELESSSIFFRLPRELRDEVYSFAFGTDSIGSWHGNLRILVPQTGRPYNRLEGLPNWMRTNKPFLKESLHCITRDREVVIKGHKSMFASRIPSERANKSMLLLTHVRLIIKLPEFRLSRRTESICSLDDFRRINVYLANLLQILKSLKTRPYITLELAFCFFLPDEREESYLSRCIKSARESGLEGLCDKAVVTLRYRSKEPSLIRNGKMEISLSEALEVVKKHAENFLKKGDIDVKNVRSLVREMPPPPLSIEVVELSIKQEVKTDRDKLAI
ncbi:hypothetical protein P280DRAFT_484185 [Massarina eburnea CBS 473.64]|uniref:Uncharacterized protein n=1 Tax=Massarina eburnea CBS 473.64 TaxID=1395130 RepID=A0A6A6RNF8_9PLEO|nr:hypothetical protein P280DRAFT_484185 [Massarina eburnea CBS 473.64]